MVQPEISTLLPLASDYLSDSRFYLETDSPASDFGEDVTGAAIDVRDGDYFEVWVTSYRAPWNVNSVYECIILNGKRAEVNA